MVHAQIREKVRKVGSSQIWVRGRLDPFLDSGWAEQSHTRDFPYGIWVLVHRNTKGVCLHLSRIQLEVAEMTIHFDCYVLLPQLNVSVRSDKWLLRYSTFNILRWSPIGYRLHSEQFSILIWSPKHKFKFLGISDQWLLRYFNLNILRFHWWSSSFQVIFNLGLVP